MRCAAGLALLLGAVLPSTGQDDSARGPALTVVSVRRTDSKLAVALRGDSKEKSGTVLQIRILPRVYELGGDGRSLLPTSTEIGAVLGRAEVRKGAFSFSFATPRAHECEVRVLAPGVSETIHTFRLFDPELVRSRHAKELKRFAEHVDAVRSYLAKLEPFEKNKSPVPMKLLKEMLDIESRIRPWAESTDIAAAAGVLQGVLSEMGLKIPFERSVDDRADEVYGPLPNPRPMALETEPFRVRLRLAEEVAVRETLLIMLGHLDDFLSAMARAEKDRSPSARAAVKTLCDLCLSLERGDLAGTYRGYEPAAGAADLLGRIKTAVEALGDPPAAEKLTKMGQEVVDLRRRMAQP